MFTFLQVLLLCIVLTVGIGVKEERMNQSISQTVNNVLFSMLARVGRLDPQPLLHLYISNGSTLCIPYFLISHFTLCSHVFLGLPLPLHPSTSNL